MPRHPIAASLLIAVAILARPCTASPDSVVVFNEIHYNPPAAQASGEWVELYNQMGIKVDVSGWTIEGIGYTFPAGSILNPGAHAVVAKSPLAGQFGPFSGILDNSGETLRLINQSGRMMDEVEYDDGEPWPMGPDGSGSTLAKLAPYTASTPAANWAASAQLGGTPGAVNFPAPAPTSGVRFSEFQPANAAAGTYWMELVNTGASSMDCTGLVVAVVGATPREYIVPSGTLAAGGLLVLEEATLGFRPAKDDRVFLFSAGRSGLLDAREASNKLRGRRAADGAWLYPKSATKGTANLFEIPDSVVISEIQYNPPALPPVGEVPAVYQTLAVFGHNGVWRYNSADENLPANWAATAHAASGNWSSGTAPIGRESATLQVPLVTRLADETYSSATVTYYFEREFTMTQAQVAAAESLDLTHQIDDGAVIYLNGVEVARINMPAGVVGPESLATTPVTDATLATTTIPAANLIAGSNRISVEVHQSTTGSTDLVFGLKLDAKLVVTPYSPPLPMRESDNQWLEIANRSAAAVSLTGWTLDDGVEFDFPAGTTLAAGEHACVVRDAARFSAAYPSARVLGTFTGSLARSGENLVLRDANKNPVDEVRYYDGGQWPEFADGGGSSLELRDMDADNAAGGAWSASDESGRTAWKTYTYSGVAAASNGPDSQWSEFNFGLLAAGEIWLDDISVIESPTGAATQKLADTGFNNAALWRLRGNHRHSQIISEPGNPGNKILRLVATGPTEHMHNQIETTLAGAITNGLDYQVSFRARWVTGMSQLHTRLYFNRLAKMNVIDRPANPGTPGAPNSRAIANLGPTITGLKHAPAVPAASQPVVVSAAAADPDGLSAANMLLYYSVNGGAFSNAVMSFSNGRYQGTVPGQAAGSVVQFYIRGADNLGAVSYLPAAAASSRALYKVNDGAAAANGLHNFRIITTNADRDFMHTITEVMSNDRIEATVIDREGDIYYGAGVRLKSSQRGRPSTNRVGYNVDFPPDGLFRGAHGGVAVDRSEGQAPGQRELLFDMMISNSGGPISRYYDLIKVLSPNSALTGSAVLQMARYEDVFLDEQFEDGGDGTLYEYELVYYPTTANAAGAKLPSPDVVHGVAVSDLGNDSERYRWHFLNKINREADNYAPIINYCKLFSLTGSAFDAAVPAAVDVDTWLRGMAYAVLSGAGDNAAAGDQHNGIYYARPDGRVIFLPHDLDFSFSETRGIFANAECAKLTADPARRRLYLGHLHDIISTTYNNSYMGIWTSHFASLDAAQDWANELTYMTNRSNNVLSQINSRIPPVSFAITTPSPQSVNASTATISGSGWVNVRDIRIAGNTEPLAATWTGDTSWQVTVPVANGSNTIVLEAVDFSGALIGSAQVQVMATTTVVPASSANLVVSEIMYHPAAPDETEIAEGFTDAEAFEYIELMNTSAAPVNLTGLAFASGIEFAFDAGTILAAGGRIVVPRDRAAFLMRYPGASASLAGSGFANASGLDNNGESIHLVAASGATIRQFTYDDHAPWPEAADGSGYSLVLIAPARNPDHGVPAHWRSSALPPGHPGASDTQPAPANPHADDDADGHCALLEYAIGDSDTLPNTPSISVSRGPDGHVSVGYRRNLSADDALIEVQSSTDLVHWFPAFSPVSEAPSGDGTSQVIVRSTAAAPATYFTRILVRTR